MALSVQTNVASLTAQRNLQGSTSRLNQNLERLSTGLKINKAADDASGLVISEFQRAQISGLEQGIANIDRAVNLVQTAESGLNEINSLLINIRQLAVDSANAGALDGDSLAANQADIDNLLGTIDRIADTTKFGTIKVLNGDSGLRGQATDSNVTFLKATDLGTATQNHEVVISTAAQRAEVTSGTDGIAAGGATLTAAETLTVNGVDITLDEGFNSTQVVNRINEYTGATGAFAVVEGTGAAATIDIRASEFGSQTRVTVLSDVAAGAGSTGFGMTFLDTDANTGDAISGVDIQGTIGGGTAIGKGNILVGDAGQTGAGIAVEINADTETSQVTVTGTQGDIVVTDNSRKFQIGAFAGDGTFTQETAQIAINKFDSDSLGIGVTGSLYQKLSDIQIGTFDGAQDSIVVIDKSIEEVATMRGDIGAFQKNTLQMVQSKVRSELQNLQEAESTVRDTDFTTEIAKFTSEQIRQQASTTVLGLANQTAQGILSLLQS